ncbi:MAG: BrnT family toxin [Elusimicrobiota bacterium]|jgi:hypothetical protein
MRASIRWGRFIWDQEKESDNLARHGIDFRTAAKAFLDSHCLMVEDSKHSQEEPRWFCIGDIGGTVVTARFTYRGRQIRLIGAGFWRKGKKLYEKTKNSRS